MKALTTERIAQILADGIMYAYMMAKENHANPNFPTECDEFPMIMALLYVDLELTNSVTREQLTKAILEHYGPTALLCVEATRIETLKKMKENGLYDPTTTAK